MNGNLVMGFFELLIVLLILPSIAIMLVDTILRLIYILVIFIKKPYIKSEPPSSMLAERPKALFVIPVRNEGKFIKETIENLKQVIDETTPPPIIVIADNCSDDTAKVGKLAGAFVISRSGGDLGKGPTLSWFAQNHKDIINAYDIVVILDADSIVDKSFYYTMCNAFSEGSSVFQSLVFPLRSDSNVWAILASYSELLSEYVDDVARSKLGWYIPLRGTGMAFRSTLFCSVVANLITQVEDIEMSVQLAIMKIPITFSLSSIVYDPKSSELMGLARQRGRWLKGQRQVMALRRDNLWKLVLDGISGLSLLQALLIKPKTLLFLIKFILLFIVCALGLEFFRNILFGIIFASFLIDLGYYLIGLGYVDDPKQYLCALLKSPGYIFVWLVSWCFSILPGKNWLRSRD